jgi:hypothetical protein
MNETPLLAWIVERAAVIASLKEENDIPRKLTRSTGSSPE